MRVGAERLLVAIVDKWTRIGIPEDWIQWDLKPEEHLNRAAMGMDCSPRTLRDQAAEISFVWETVCSGLASCTVEESLDILYGLAYAYSIGSGWIPFDPSCSGTDSGTVCNECKAAIVAPVHYALFISWGVVHYPDDFPVLRGLGIETFGVVIEALSGVEMNPRLVQELKEIADG